MVHSPQGKHAAGTPLKNLVPRTPLGPSEVLIAGMPRRGIPAKCQKSVPESREIFSASVSCSNVDSTSKSWCFVCPVAGEAVSAGMARGEFDGGVLGKGEWKR